MAHRSELLLINGITPQIYNVLTFFITALPATGVAVNINTAPKNVLLSVVKGITAADVDALIDSREEAPFKSKSDIEAHPVLTNYQNKGSLGAESNYFAVRSNVNVGKARVRVISMLQLTRGVQGSAGNVKIHLRMREDIF